MFLLCFSSLWHSHKQFNSYQPKMLESPGSDSNEPCLLMYSGRATRAAGEHRPEQTGIGAQEIWALNLYFIPLAAEKGKEMAAPLQPDEQARAEDSLRLSTKAKEERMSLSHWILVGTCCKTKLSLTFPLAPTGVLHGTFPPQTASVSLYCTKIPSTYKKPMKWVAKQVIHSDLLSALAQTNRSIH